MKEFKVLLSVLMTAACYFASMGSWPAAIVFVFGCSLFAVVLFLEAKPKGPDHSDEIRHLSLELADIKKKVDSLMLAKGLGR